MAPGPGQGCGCCRVAPTAWAPLVGAAAVPGGAGPPRCSHLLLPLEPSPRTEPFLPRAWAQCRDGAGPGLCQQHQIPAPAWRAEPRPQLPAAPSPSFPPLPIPSAHLDPIIAPSPHGPASRAGTSHSLPPAPFCPKTCAAPRPLQWDLQLLGKQTGPCPSALGQQQGSELRVLRPRIPTAAPLSWIQAKTRGKEKRKKGKAASSHSLIY